MTRVAVIGSGVAGLSATYAMRGQAEVVIFEKDDRVGGHASTVEVEEGGRLIGIDTAFVVFNPHAYPRFCSFLDEAGVGWVPHVGGFTFFDRASGVQYSSDDFVLPRAELERRYPGWLCKVIEEAARFHRESGGHLRTGEANRPLGEYLERQGYSAGFREAYLGLLAMVVWSVPPELIWTMPASTVIAFFFWHGIGGLGGTRIDWRTVRGGCVNYVRRLLEIARPDVRTGVEVVAVEDTGSHVEVRTADGPERFDYAVLAIHADDACRLLAGARSEPQRELLAPVRYNRAHVVLHGDATVMPADRASWRTWNYGSDSVDGLRRGWVVYYMNRVQELEARRDYFVTVDYPRALAPDAIIREFMYTHPIIDTAVHDIQERIYSLNELNRIKLCGTYFHARGSLESIGFHEAGFSSGAEAGSAVLAMEARRRATGEALP